jgi:hypothetical protein
MDRHRHQLQLQHVAANGQQDIIQGHDGERDDSRHFGRLLDAINIGSNDILPSTAADDAHEEQWPQAGRPLQKQVTRAAFFVVCIASCIFFMSHSDLRKGRERSRIRESLEFSTN